MFPLEEGGTANKAQYVLLPIAWYLGAKRGRILILTSSGEAHVAALRTQRPKVTP